METSEQKLEWGDGVDEKGASYVWADLPDEMPGTVRIYEFGKLYDRETQTWNPGYCAYWSESGEDVSDWENVFGGHVFPSIDDTKAKCESNIEDIPQFETDCTSDAVCPYCGYTDYESYEIDFPQDGDSHTERDCPNCGKPYKVYREVAVTYSTVKIKKP